VTLYKVTGPSGEPLHGGFGNWPLPHDGEPGAWREVNGELVMRRRGLHLTSEPARWWRPGCRIFPAEAEGIRGEPDADRKVVCRRARLLRELTTPVELATVNIFLSGDHDIAGEVVAVALESSSVVAWGSSRVVAWGSSRVEAWESSSVEAWGSSRVVAWESSSVVARESSSVEPHGAVTVISWAGRAGSRIMDRVVWIDRSKGEPQVYMASTPAEGHAP
jgi:hypothetical protein